MAEGNSAPASILLLLLHSTATMVWCIARYNFHAFSNAFLYILHLWNLHIANATMIWCMASYSCQAFSNAFFYISVCNFHIVTFDFHIFLDVLLTIWNVTVSDIQMYFLHFSIWFYTFPTGVFLLGFFANDFSSEYILPETVALQNIPLNLMFSLICLFPHNICYMNI